MSERSYFDIAQDALNKMCRASKRGTGCHLSAEEIAALEVTQIGSLWSQDDPRRVAGAGTQEGGK